MKCPPMFIIMKFRSNEGDHSRGFGLWIPLFIIVPIALIILLALFLIALPFILLSMLFTWDVGLLRWLSSGVPALFGTMHALQGLKMDVENDKHTVYLDIK